MVDSSKRKSLMSLGGVMALPFVPGMVSASTGASKKFKPVLNTQPISQVIPSIDSDLSITLLTNGAPVMKVTNTSDELAIVRKINPGVIHIGDKSYDMNHSLVGSAYAIGAGKTRVIPVHETSSTASETTLDARYGRKHFRVASITTDNGPGQLQHNNVLFA